MMSFKKTIGLAIILSTFLFVFSYQQADATNCHVEMQSSVNPKEIDKDSGSFTVQVTLKQTGNDCPTGFTGKLTYNAKLGDAAPLTMILGQDTFNIQGQSQKTFTKTFKAGDDIRTAGTRERGIIFWTVASGRTDRSYQVIGDQFEIKLKNPDTSKGDDGRGNPPDSGGNPSGGQPTSTGGGSSDKGLVPCGNTIDDPCTFCDFFELADNVKNFIMFKLVPPVAVVLVAIAGFFILTAGANPSGIARGKKILTDLAWGILIIFGAFMVTNTIFKILASGTDVADSWYTIDCSVQGGVNVGGGNPPPGSGAPPGPGKNPPPGGPPSESCKQKFGASLGQGCPNSSSCVSGASLTSSHGCASSNGVCPVSQNTFTRAQQLISNLNTLSQGKCTLRVSSTIQVNGGPSRSMCHKPSNAKSGTCIDFNISPSSQDCFSKFYQAARDSGAVSSFTNEYVAACHEATQTGGNIHTNF